MSTKEAVEKIKSMLFGDMVQPEPVPTPAEAAKFMDYKLKSGAVVAIDKLDVGGSVTLDGQPAPDGEHEFEDGTKIVVSGGLITEVKPSEGPSVEVEVEAMKKLPGQFSAIELSFAEQAEEVKELKKTIQKQEEALKQMFNLVEKIANNSIEKPIEKVRSFEEMTPLEKFRAQK
jgi:hypothetical protein